MHYDMPEPIDRSVVERIAKIVGESSAASKALADLDKRIFEGQADVCIYQIGTSFFVGPAPTMKITLDRA